MARAAMCLVLLLLAAFALYAGALRNPLVFDDELLREAYRVLPDVGELELVESVAGLRPATPDNLPLIEPGAIEGLVLACGHFRNGILLAPATADAIAGWALGTQVVPSAQSLNLQRFGRRP